MYWTMTGIIPCRQNISKLKDNNMSDFVGQPVYRCVGYTNIAFGRIVAQEMRGVWLWVSVNWDEGRKELEDLIQL